MSVLLALLAATAAPAQAERLPTMPLPALFAAYQEICLDHIDNSDAQIDVAIAAPYALHQIETKPDGTKTLSDGQLILSVLGKGNVHYCMISSFVERSVSLADGRALAEPVLGKPSETDATSLGWYQKDRDKTLLHAFMLNEDKGDLLASFASGVE